MASLKPLPAIPNQASEKIQHSTLEVDHDRLLENDSKAAPILGHDPKHEKIITCTHVSKQALPSYNEVGKQVVISSHYVDEHAAVGDPYNPQQDLAPSTKQHKILGLKRKTFMIILAVVIFLIVAGGASGGAGETIAMRDQKPTTTVSKNIPSPTTRLRYANTGLAAMQYTDPNGTLHKRIYYQDKNNTIRESAWDDSTAFDAAWQVNAISDAVKPNTPIAAAAGYPHASYSYTLVRFSPSISTSN